MRATALALLLLFSTAVFADDDAELRSAVKLLGDIDAADAVFEEWPPLGENLGLVAAVYDGEEATLLKVGIVEKTAKGLRLVARSDEVEGLTSEPPHRLWVSLDRTTFSISPSEDAIAVSVSNSFNSTARHSSSTAVHLFRWKGKKLTPIFEHILDYGGAEKADDDEEEGDGEENEFEEKWTVFFSKTKTRGFYDLVVRDLQTKKTTTYRWNGNRYVARN